MIHFQPNTPYYVRIADPEGSFDFEAELGQYQTVDGEVFRLPRSAVVKLNDLGLKRGEEIQITKHWSGRRGELPEWTIALSTRSEVDRAESERGEDFTETLRESIAQVEASKRATPIRKPIAPAVQQPKLFDRRGTGTHGPAPAPVVPVPVPAIARHRSKPEQIPANVAVREILAFINADPNTANWSDQARQDMASTVIIAAYKAGHVGLWEREE